MAIKDRLYTLRKSSGLSQRALADRLGLSSGSIGNYESGLRVPDDEAMNALAAFFNIPVADLAYGPQLSPDQYAEYVLRISEALDHTSSEDLAALDLSETAIRAAIRQRVPIRQDRAAEIAHALAVRVDDLIYAEPKPSNKYEELMARTKTATDDQLRRLLTYYNMIEKGEL